MIHGISPAACTVQQQLIWFTRCAFRELFEVQPVVGHFANDKLRVLDVLICDTTAPVDQELNEQFAFRQTTKRRIEATRR